MASVQEMEPKGGVIENAGSMKVKENLKRYDQVRVEKGKGRGLSHTTSV